MARWTSVELVQKRRPLLIEILQLAGQEAQTVDVPREGQTRAVYPVVLTLVADGLQLLICLGEQDG